MIVNAEQTQKLTVELNEKTIREITISTVAKLFDMPKTAYIKNGNLMHDIRYRTWFEEKIVRRATEDDIIGVNVLDKLNSQD